MYQPSQFVEDRPDVLHALVRAQPLATLVTQGPQGPEAQPLPLLLRTDAQGGCTLVGHVARANPVWRDTDARMPVLAIFQGPQHYISPGWYATKAEHGKAVPTWNYVHVQARGLLSVHDDADWVRRQMEQLTAQQEAAMPQSWSMADAPPDYIASMIAAVVGIEIAVQSWVGKWKVSQNQPAINQTTVQHHLLALGTDAARAMAAQVHQPGVQPAAKGS